jgi:hypothetical protein
MRRVARRSGSASASAATATFGALPAPGRPPRSALGARGGSTAPAPGQGQPRPHGQTVVLDWRPAGPPTVQRRGRAALRADHRGRRWEPGAGGQQAGADPLGDAQPRRGLSGRLRALTIRGDFHQLRGRSSSDGRIGRTARLGPRADHRGRSGPARAEPVMVHELRARSHDWVPVRGSHQGRRPIRRIPQAQWMAAAKTTLPEREKALAEREASMDGPSEETVDDRRVKIWLNGERGEVTDFRAWSARRRMRVPKAMASRGGPGSGAGHAGRTPRGATGE